MPYPNFTTLATGLRSLPSHGHILSTGREITRLTRKPIGPKVEIRDTPQPKPGPKQVVIKVIVSGSNPKDWKVPKYIPGEPLNQGDDIAGYVHEVGSDVFEFKPGDRVAAFHEMLKPYGSYGEYAIAEQHATFHIPAATSFEGM